MEFQKGKLCYTSLKQRVKQGTGTGSILICIMQRLCSMNVVLHVTIVDYIRLVNLCLPTILQTCFYCCSKYWIKNINSEDDRFKLCHNLQVVERWSKQDKSPGITFFGFPNDPKLVDVWVHRCYRQDGVKVKTGSNFSEHCWVRLRQSNNL